jgi:hypothetical protein
MAGAVYTQGRRTGAKKIAAIIIVAAVVCILGLLVYSSYAISIAAKNVVPIPVHVSGPPSVNAVLVSQNLLSYANTSSLLPFALLSYSTTNASYIAANFSVFKSITPSGVYVLNTSDECFNCGSTTAIVSALANSLVSYNLIENQSNVSIVPISGLASLPNDSILIIMNGLLPSQLLTPSASHSLLQLMLNKGISIIYVGQDFSRLLLPGPLVIPATTNSIPGFLQTMKTPYYNSTTSGFLFNESTFAFAGGSGKYGPMTYTQVANGSIVAFPNFPSSWTSSEGAGKDLAKAVQELFWLPRYTTGYAVAQATPNATKDLGVIGSGVSIINISYAKAAAEGLNSGYARVVISANSIRGSNTVYRYLYFRPAYWFNGTISVSPFVVAAQQAPVVMTIATHSSTPIFIQPHLSVYTLNMSRIVTIPLPFATASNNFTFDQYINFSIGPGRYLLVLDSDTDSQYAAACFNISQISITLIRANFSSGAFVFSLFSEGRPLSGTYYNMTLNNLYERNGTVSNGAITYMLPKGTPEIYGNLTFAIDMLSQQFVVNASNIPGVITINKQYVELLIVGIVILLMIELVRAPNKDEFYIDVPSLPEQKKTNIKLRAREVLASFDKLNMHYHWKYMPLSNLELRTAISSDIRYNNMPVSLTYNNVEAILNQLTVGGYVIGAEELYAPKAWTEQSGHDIEYLVTFKKLRLYLVTHSYMFTDIDSSNLADIVATSLRSERKYITIYSETTRFKKVPIYEGSKSYLAFMNSEMLEEFKSNLYSSMTRESEILKVNLSTGVVGLLDADDPGELLD